MTEYELADTLVLPPDGTLERTMTNRYVNACEVCPARQTTIYSDEEIQTPLRHVRYGEVIDSLAGRKCAMMDERMVDHLAQTHGAVR